MSNRLIIINANNKSEPNADRLMVEVYVVPSDLLDIFWR